jgi:ABC-type nitrate/sulfonate/bicarbonate transport system permease component
MIRTIDPFRANCSFRMFSRVMWPGSLPGLSTSMRLSKMRMWTSDGML